jgi:hypothetical protein
MRIKNITNTSNYGGVIVLIADAWPQEGEIDYPEGAFIDKPEALVQDPLLVKRLRRLRVRKKGVNQSSHDPISTVGRCKGPASS